METRTLLSFALALVAGAALAVPAAVPDELVCKGIVQARLPPSLGPPNPKFKYPPPGYFAGQFFQTYSSINDSTLEYRNIQLLSVFEGAGNITYDLTSFTVGDCPHIFTLFGYHNNSGTAAHEDDFNVYEPGTNITHMQDLVAYGRDTRCDRYFVLYGREPNKGGLIISSSIRQGPSQATLEAIKTAFKKLGNKEIAKTVDELKHIPVDGNRDGLADFICDEKCRTNQNAPPSDGSCPDA